MWLVGSSLSLCLKVGKLSIFLDRLGVLRSEVRGQNAFMKKLMMIHAVTMGLLLAGMFGLSMVAMELSKETKVGAEGKLVTQSGEAVRVGSSEMQIVSGPDGSQQLHTRASSDGRRLDESESQLVTVNTPAAVILDLGVGSTDGDRRLAQGNRYYELTYSKVRDLLDSLPRGDAHFTLYLGKKNGFGDAMIETGSIVGELVDQDLAQNRRKWAAARGGKASMKVRLMSQASGKRSAVSVSCAPNNDPCKVSLVNKNGRMDGISLGLFLLGGELDSDGYYPDGVLCLKMDDSAGCQMNEPVVFKSVASIVLQQDVSLILVDGKVKSGQLSGMGADVEVLVVRHWRNGNWKQSQPLENGSGGEFVRRA